MSRIQLAHLTVLLMYRQGYLRRLWRGYVPLPITYWVWGVIANFAWVIVAALAVATDLLALMLLVLLLQLAYYVFISVAIWRSSGRYRGKRVWAELARISVAAGIAKSVASLVFRL